MKQMEAIRVAKCMRSSCAMPDDILARMLTELEGRIEIELHDKLDWTDTADLSVPNPYDRLYWTFLVSMMDLYEGRLESYRAIYAEFCRAYESYANHCRRQGR